MNWPLFTSKCFWLTKRCWEQADDYNNSTCSTKISILNPIARKKYPQKCFKRQWQWGFRRFEPNKIHWPIFRPFRVDRENQYSRSLSFTGNAGWKKNRLEDDVPLPIQSMGLVYLPTFDYIWFIFDGKYRHIIHGCYGPGGNKPLLVWGRGNNYFNSPTTKPKRKLIFQPSSFGGKLLVTSRWRFQTFFYLHPEPWGIWTHFDVHIFQRGWFNHQLVHIYTYIWEFMNRKKKIVFSLLGSKKPKFFLTSTFWAKA